MKFANNSLDYKFNKAKAFSKANADIMERVNELSPKYKICIKGMDDCDTLCERANDYLDGHRTKKAMRTMDELETCLDDARERIRIVTKALDNILEKETEVRDFANALKERFASVKTVTKTIVLLTLRLRPILILVFKKLKMNLPALKNGCMPVNLIKPKMKATRLPKKSMWFLVK